MNRGPKKAVSGCLSALSPGIAQKCFNGHGPRKMLFVQFNIQIHRLQQIDTRVAYINNLHVDPIREYRSTEPNTHIWISFNDTSYFKFIAIKHVNPLVPQCLNARFP